MEKMIFFHLYYEFEMIYWDFVLKIDFKRRKT